MPAYLDHKVQTLTNSIRSLNEVFYATLNNGSLPRKSREKIKDWVEKTKNIAHRSPESGYIDQSIVLTEWLSFIRNHKEDSSWFGSDKSLMEKAISKENIEKCFNVVNLTREIQYCSDLYNSIESELEKRNFLVIKTAN